MGTLAMRLVIVVLHGMEAQEFIVPLDLTGPGTLTIDRGEFGLGNTIKIIDINQEQKVWYAGRIFHLEFQWIEETEERASQSAQKVGALWTQ